MKIKSLVYELTHPILGKLRSNRRLIRYLFGVNVPSSVQVAYDPTTIALSHAVRQTATEEDMSFFEMGIGQAALVSLSLAGDRGVEVQGADCSEARVNSSRVVAIANRAQATFICSDLFASVPDENRYDLIFFNVPYVPTDEGRKLQLTERLGVDGDQVWDGGDDGTQVLRRFLVDAKAFLSDRGRVIFGVQNIFVPDERVLELLDEVGYTLAHRFRRRLVPSCCYVVRPK